VLRSDSCKCEFPQAIRESIDAALALEQEQGGANDADDQNIDDEVELEISSEAFPRDRYKALSEIGKGALGVVYLCRDRLLGKKVAIKCLRSISSEQSVNFQMEAKATSQLKHPGVVSVMDFGSIDGGAPYMVMEYIKGFTLEQSITDDGPLSLEGVVSVFSRAADALAYAHQKGIFHRDLKSSNIMIVDSAEKTLGVKIIDFGIATIREATLEPTLLNGSMIVGTPAYMSPDQALGLEYDERSEIYSLGCSMFEALTGRPPFIGESALETINMHALMPPPKLVDCKPDVTFPEEIEKLVAKTLAKDRNDRFSSMTELKDALENIRVVDNSEKQLVSANKPKRNTAPIAAIIILVIVAATTAYILIANSAPSHAEAVRLNKIAWQQLSAEQYDESIENAQRAFKKDPSYAPSLETLALSQMLRGHEEAALKTINEALALAQKHRQRATIVSCFFHRGVIYKSMAHYNKGIDSLNRSAGYEPEAWELARFAHLISNYNLKTRQARLEKVKRKQANSLPTRSTNINRYGPAASVRGGNDFDLQQAGQDPSIKELGIFDGTFTESGTKHLGNLQLEKLVVLSAQIPYNFFSVLNLKKLKTLDITDQKVDPEIFDKLDGKTIETIKIDCCDFADATCEKFLRLKSLRDLKIIRCPGFNGSGWKILKHMPIETLGWITTVRKRAVVTTPDPENLDTYDLNSLQPVAIKQSYPYSAFDDFLSAESFTAVILDSDFLDLKNCKQLEKVKRLQTLDLSGTTPLAPHHMQLIASLPKLNRLNLSGPLLRRFDILSQFHHVKHMSFINVDLLPSDIETLSKFKLNSIHISQIAIHEECFQYLSAMKSLKKLTIGSGLGAKSPGLEKLKKELPNCYVKHTLDENYL